jgi:hypothetical protein
VLTKTVETQVTVGKCSGDVHSCIAGTPPTKQVGEVMGIGSKRYIPATYEKHTMNMSSKLNYQGYRRKVALEIQAATFRRI